MLKELLFAAYVTASLGLFVYGANCYVMVLLFLRTRRKAQHDSAAVIAAEARRFERHDLLPMVTTQIPVYNEANVVERAMRAAAGIDYPRDRHEIQVLDDSTDETCAIVDRVAEELRRQGVDLAVVRRSQRQGFKAGALAAGLEIAKGEFVAIFDADFTPPSHFLRWTLPFFFRDPALALVQGRWGHLNDRESPLTRAQAMGIDGHFMIEQSARTFNGLLMNFNGTAGLWRRRAIDDAGGWENDTLTEDLDLSYRAQLAGWRTHFVSNLVVPGELPASVGAFKSQQFRWAKGSIQTACKLLPRVYRSPLPLWVKIQATLHLTHYVVHPLMLTVAILALPAMIQLSRAVPTGWLILIVALLVISVLAPNSLYFASQRALYRDWARRLLWLPALTCLGVGIGVSNSRAVFEALVGKRSEFVRTPKRGDRAAKRYRVRGTVLPWIEVALGLYCLASLIVYLAAGRVFVGPFLMIYAAGFLAIGAAGLAEGLMQMQWKRRQRLSI
ncbi:MAG TPA: glycosyltransferase [Opitutaceae bacterium]|jgi:cellulose synthase/poly-beta-1,6-N-acetylglucosamine synthase-like glycosyltransferase